MARCTEKICSTNAMSSKIPAARLVTLFLVLLSVGFISCRAIAPMYKGGAVRPNYVMALNSSSKVDEIWAGYWVYRQRCMDCHSKRVPRIPTDGRLWHSDPMGLNLYRSMSTSERFHVREYMYSMEGRDYTMNAGLKVSEIEIVDP